MDTCAVRILLLVLSMNLLNLVGRVQAAEIYQPSMDSLYNTPGDLYNGARQTTTDQLVPAQPPSALPQQPDPQTSKLLRDSINKVTQLINSYSQNGLSNMPALPNLPGLGSLMTVPDKILRAELSMLQDEIKMAQSMMQNPMYATMNIPKDLTNMVVRMTKQLEQ